MRDFFLSGLFAWAVMLLSAFMVGISFTAGYFILKAIGFYLPGASL